MSNRAIHHEVVEKQQGNRRIKKATLHLYKSKWGKQFRRNRSRRCHLFMLFPEYREVWKKNQLLRFGKPIDKVSTL